jgi:hypothetical protein
MTMTAVTTKKSAENAENVRRLLRKKQPEFAAALELAAELVGRELAPPQCCAISAAMPRSGHQG